MRVIVIGGGIMGLCTALSLRRSGHRVALYEQGPIPNPAGSSVDHHRLIRHPYGPLSGYARLIDPAIAAWDRVWESVGQRLFHPTGTIAMARGDGSWIEQSLKDMADLGIATEVLDAAGLQRRAPMLHSDGIELAAWIDSGGVLFADRIVAAVAKQLVLSGATVHTHTPVIEIDTARGAIALEDGTRARADALVVACGPWVRSLAPSTVGRVKPSRQVVAYLDPPDAHRTAWASAPMILDIHSGGGIYAVPPCGNTPLKVGDHSFSRKGHPDRKRNVRPGEAEALKEACRTRFRGIDDYAITGATTCFYTVQADERFIVERRERAVIMTGFSGHGFKFGALMGELASAMVTERVDPDEGSLWAAGGILDNDRSAAITTLCLG